MNTQPPSSVSSAHPRIGVFDSGVGGLSVLDRLVRQFPRYRFTYLADTLNMPYGLKTFGEVESLVCRIIDWFCQQQQAEMLVVACNTMSTVILDRLQDYSPVPLIEPITPICQWLAGCWPHVDYLPPTGLYPPQYKKVGLIATTFTVRCNAYAKQLNAFGSSIELNSVACPDLARIIEIGAAETEEGLAMLRHYLEPLVDWGMDALILGCTHYAHIEHHIRAIIPAHVDVLDPAIFIAQRMAAELVSASHSEENTSPQPIHYFVSDNPHAFQQVSSQLPLKNLNVDIPHLALNESAQAISLPLI